MPYSNIDKPSKYFDTKLYTGNGSTQSITGLEFAPKFTWLKHRNNATAYSHQLYDIVRGATNYLVSNTTAAENDGGSSCSTCLTSFNSDGFSLGSNAGINSNGVNHVSWNWRGSDSSAVSNTSGTITSTVSANTTSGFSVVSYTGNGTSGATVGHGIGSTIGMMLVKGRSFVDNWAVYHKSIGGTGLLELNGTGGTNTVSTRWNNTNAGATVFTLGNNSQVNGNGSTYIAYCFAEVKGFSKFGSYTGNGSADGTFIYTGMRPAFIITKRTDTTSQWQLLDNKRLGYNPSNSELYADSTEVENTVTKLDILSNGFKLRTTSTTQNASGGTYIYAAFADNPFVSSKGIPTTAR